MVAGLAIGSFVGMPQLGLTLGSILGQALFPTELPGVQGPRLSDEKVTTSTIGSAIPIVYGTTVVAGNIIWSGPLVEIANTEEVGGKGGPTQDVTNYTYTRSFAIGLCEGPASAIVRLWRAEKLVYDVRPQQDDETDAAYAERSAANEAFAEGFTLYPGDEAQLADPTIEAIEGVGNVPAHRGLAYIVFEDHDVTDVQGRPPNFRFEVAMSSTDESTTITDLLPSEFYPWVEGAADLRNCENDHEYAALGHLDDWGTLEEALEIARGDLDLDYTVSGSVIGCHAQSGILQPFLIAPYDSITVGERIAPYLLFNDSVEVELSLGQVNAANNDAALSTVLYAAGVRSSIYFWWTGNWTNGATWSGFFVYLPVGQLPEGPTSNSDQWQNYTDGYGSFTGHYLWLLRDTQIAVRRLVRAPENPCQPRCDDDYPLVPENNSYCVINGELDRNAGYSSISTTGYKTLSNLETFANDVIAYPLGPIVATGSASDTEAAWEARYAEALSDGEVIPDDWVYGVDYPVTPDYVYTRSWNRNAVLPVEPTVGSIAQDLCLKAGLDAGRLDVSELTETVPGYRIASLMTARQAIQPLQSYSFFDVIESDCLLRFPVRGSAIVASLGVDDLAAHEPGGEVPNLVTMERQQDVELPRLLRVHYEAKTKNYEPGMQPAERKTTNAENKEDIELAIAMDDDKAAQIADVLMQDRWWGRESYKASASPRWLALEPGDCIEIPVEGQTERTRIVSMDMPLPFGPLALDLIRDDDGSYVSHAVGATAVPSTDVVGVAGPTEVLVIDGPALLSGDDDAGVYVAVSPALNSQNWQGATIYISSDNGASYQQRNTIRTRATTGTSSLLADGTTVVWDYVNTVTVTLRHGSLESRSEEAVLNGANAAFIGADDRWELIQFQTATLNMDGTYTLSNLLRGRRGTEHATANHEAGDTFVLVGAGLVRLPLELSAVGQTRIIRAVTLGTSLQYTSEQEIEPEGVALECYSPVNLEGIRALGNDLTLTWQRRARYHQEMPDGTDVPLVEASERYEVEILDDVGTVLRVLTTTTPSVVYTWDQQMADFGFVSDILTVRVYQLSEAVGRGYPLEETLDVPLTLDSNGNPPVNPPQLIVVTFEGVFSDDDDFYFWGELAGTGAPANKTLLGAGKSSMEDYAIELATWLLATFDNITVDRVAEEVTIGVARGMWLSHYTNTASVVDVTMQQAPLGVQAGTTQIAFVDLYQLVGDVWQLAPSNSSAYLNAGTASITLEAEGITYADKQALGFGDGQWGARTFTLNWPVSASGSYYLPKISDLADRINDTSGLTTLDITAALGASPEMSRGAVQVFGDGGYQVTVLRAAYQTSSHPSGFKPLIEEIQTAVADLPSGAKQLTTVFYGLGADDLVEGQIFSVTLDGIEYAYEITAGDEIVGGLVPVFDGLKALIEASGDFDVTFNSDLSYIEIERDVVNTPFTCTAYASYGGRVVIETE